MLNSPACNEITQVTRIGKSGETLVDQHVVPVNAFCPIRNREFRQQYVGANTLLLKPGFKHVC
jgi:hypothetical protein